MAEHPSPELLAAAKQGDHAAFEQLFAPHIPALRGVLRNIVGRRDEVDDLSQQTLLKAFEGLGSFRAESGAGTWLCAVGVRLAIDHLRARKRWRERAQVVYAAECRERAAWSAEVGGALSAPDYSYDVGEHIAYCFTCVGRTLEPEAQAALVLRDVLELSNDEAARALGVTRSVLRHHLAAARGRMQGTYEGLCALVNKQGACWQCAGLREASPEGRRGPDVPERLDWAERLHTVRRAALDGGNAHRLHDVFFRRTDEQEEQEIGDPNASHDFGRPSPDCS